MNSSLKNSISQRGQHRQLSIMLVVLLHLTLYSAPNAFGVSPAPDGFYPGGNTAEGRQALLNLTTGIGNTALGFHALMNETTADFNTATGAGALVNDTTGGSNAAHGYQALFHNTTGATNTAGGASALFNNTTGSDNAAYGYRALFSATSFENAAFGSRALEANTTGAGNVGVGYLALTDNTTGAQNTASGQSALASNTTGGSNTATGSSALASITTSSLNTAIGASALQFTTGGFFNTATGAQALQSASGNNNMGFGYQAGINLTTGNDNIDIGNTGVAAEAATIRIGTIGTQTRAFVAGISGATVAGGVGVIIDTNGQLGTVVSSERYKDAIQPMDKASEAIHALKPVTFHYKKELDPKAIPQFGLVAEEVEKVNPHLVARDRDGKVYTVRYEAVNAMLLNEFLKEHRKVEQQGRQLQEQAVAIASQQKQIEALTSGLRKVNDKVELSRSAPELVENDQ